MNEINRRSPYWLSPGIDVPTRDEFLLLSSRRTLRGFYVNRDTSESAFVPTADFMRESPLWRIDVLDDIADGLQRTRTHALVACFRECHDAQEIGHRGNDEWDLVTVIEPVQQHRLAIDHLLCDKDVRRELAN